MSVVLVSLQFLINGDGVRFAVHFKFNFLAFHFVDVDGVVVAVYFKFVILHFFLFVARSPGLGGESPRV